MSETVIFVIGAIVFAITVYGAVMAAGLALTKAEIEQDPRPDVGTDAKRQLKRRFPFRMKY